MGSSFLQCSSEGLAVAADRVEVGVAGEGFRVPIREVFADNLRLLLGETTNQLIKGEETGLCAGDEGYAFCSGCCFHDVFLLRAAPGGGFDAPCAICWCFLPEEPGEAARWLPKGLCQIIELIPHGILVVKAYFSGLRKIPKIPPLPALFSFRRFPRGFSWKPPPRGAPSGPPSKGPPPPELDLQPPHPPAIQTTHHRCVLISKNLPREAVHALLDIPLG